jgi:hypothetical protein
MRDTAGDAKMDTTDDTQGHAQTRKVCVERRTVDVIGRAGAYHTVVTLTVTRCCASYIASAGTTCSSYRFRATTQPAAGGVAGMRRESERWTRQDQVQDAGASWDVARLVVVPCVVPSRDVPVATLG